MMLGKFFVEHFSDAKHLVLDISDCAHFCADLHFGFFSDAFFAPKAGDDDLVSDEI